MTVHEQLLADLVQPVLEEWAGESAVYSDARGQTTDCTAIFGDERQTEEDTDQGRMLRRELSVTLFRSAVPDPTLQGTITRDGEVWPIEEILGRNAAQVLLRLGRVESVERSRAGFRAPKR
jgi:hypothetical protein